MKSTGLFADARRALLVDGQESLNRLLFMRRISERLLREELQRDAQVVWSRLTRVDETAIAVGGRPAHSCLGDSAQAWVGENQH